MKTSISQRNWWKIEIMFWENDMKPCIWYQKISIYDCFHLNFHEKRISISNLNLYFFENCHFHILLYIISFLYQFCDLAHAWFLLLCNLATFVRPRHPLPRPRRRDGSEAIPWPEKGEASLDVKGSNISQFFLHDKTAWNRKKANSLSMCILQLSTLS